MTRIRLRIEGLTMKEYRELLSLLRESNDVADAELYPPVGVMMTRGIQASLSAMDIVIRVAGSTVLCAIVGGTLSKAVAKPFEDIGKGFSEEMNCTEWGRCVARFFKAIPRRPATYEPTVSIYQLETDEQQNPPGAHIEKS